MLPLVVDTSISLAWVLPDESSLYAEAVLIAVENRPMRVPALWPYEMGNGLAMAYKKGRLSDGYEKRIAISLSRIIIEVETVLPLNAMQESARAAAQLGLTAYDAAYVDLALREGLELATLDKAMRKAALQAGVVLFEP